MKKIMDKIILTISCFICIFSFFLLIEQLPIFLNDFFNTTIFKNSQSIFFFAFLFLFSYSFYYYHNKIDKKKNEQKDIRYKELMGLNNFYLLDFNNLRYIANINLELNFTIHLTITSATDNWNIYLELQDFANLSNQEDLTNLDNFIGNLLIKIDFKNPKVHNEYWIETSIKEYLDTNLSKKELESV